MKGGMTVREREIAAFSAELRTRTKQRRSYRRDLLRMTALIARCGKSDLDWDDKHKMIFGMWDAERGYDKLARLGLRLEWANRGVSKEEDVTSFVDALTALKMAVMLVEP